MRTRDITALIVAGAMIQLLLLGFFRPTYDFFEVGQGHGNLGAILALSPMGLGMLTSLFVAYRLLHAHRVGETIAVGLAVVALAVGMMAFQPLTAPFLWQATALFLFGFALLATKTVWTNGFFQTVTDDYVGANAAMSSATVQIGAAIGAVLGTTLPIHFGQATNAPWLGQLQTSAEQVERPAQALALALITRLEPGINKDSPLLLAAYQAALASGYAQTCLVLAGLALLAAIVIAVGVRRSLRYRARVAGSAILD